MSDQVKEATKALLGAIDKGDVKGMAAAISQGADLKMSTTDEERPYTALHQVAVDRQLVSGNEAAMRFCLDNGVSVHVTDWVSSGMDRLLALLVLCLPVLSAPARTSQEGKTPLHWAAELNGGRPHVLKFLLDNKADKTMKDKV